MHRRFKKNYSFCHLYTKVCPHQTEISENIVCSNFFGTHPHCFDPIHITLNHASFAAAVLSIAVVSFTPFSFFLFPFHQDASVIHNFNNFRLHMLVKFWTVIFHAKTTPFDISSHSWVGETRVYVQCMEARYDWRVDMDEMLLSIYWAPTETTTDVRLFYSGDFARRKMLPIF